MGVAAVVEGLSGFLGDMGKMDDSIRKLVSPTNILGSVFGTLGNILEGVGSFIANTLAHALGELLADAVEWVTKQIQEMVSASIEMANELQRLEVRLNGLNMPKSADEVENWDEAMQAATTATQEQLDWLQQLAVAAPFGPTQIADIYTAARSMDFADAEARDLTKSILEFAAGMGLTDVEAERIIVNLRQMGTRGKVTGREMADLARGALLPLDDVLGRMAKDMGISTDELNKLIASAEGVDPKIFVKAFEEMTKEEPRFIGAMGRLGRTFEFATKNFKEFIANLGAKNIVTPIFKILGERIASITDQFVKFNDQGELIHTELWDSAIDAATRVGTAVSDVITALLDLAPSADGIANGIVDALNGIADWLDSHKDDLVKFVQDSAAWFQNTLLPAVQQVWDFLFGSDMQPGAIQKFGDWLKNDFLPFIQREVIPGVTDLFDAITGKKKAAPTTMSGDKQGGATEDTTALQNVVAGVASLATALPSVLELLGAIGLAVMAAFGSNETQTFAEFVSETLIPAIQNLTAFVNENRDSFTFLFKALIALEIIGFIAGLIAGLIAQVIAFGISVAALTPVVMTIGAITAVVRILALVFGVAITSIILWVGSLINTFRGLLANTVATFNNIMAAIKNKDWKGAGKALVDGLVNGIQMGWSNLINTVTALAQNALSVFNSIFAIQSPSKVMADIGTNIVKGLAKGVKDSTGIAVKAMTNTAASVMAAATPQMAYSPAITSPAQNTIQTNNNFNATFSSNTQREPLVADFAMMSSLVGSG